MTLQESIVKALNDVGSKDFLHGQLGTIRENILESEKRINKNSTLILLLIAVSELINRQVILKITFFSTDITQLSLVLLVMPCLISFYTYTLINQLLLRANLRILYHGIIKSKQPLIAELGIDDFLVTHLNSTTEEILTSGKKSLMKNIINVLSAPSELFFQYVPLFYCVYLLFILFRNPSYTRTSLWLISIVTGMSFIRAILLSVAFFGKLGNFTNLVTEFMKNDFGGTHRGNSALTSEQQKKSKES